MTTALKNKYFKYLFWAAPALIIMGLTAGVVSGMWVPVPLGLMLVGSIGLIVWFGYQIQNQNNFWGQRSTVAGTNALAATLSVLLILGLLNFLAFRYPARVDLSENQRFTLAPQTKQFVQNLKEPVKVIIFDRAPITPDKELLENYRRQNQQNFSFSYIDPQLFPSVAEQFAVTRAGEVHLQAGEKKQFLMTVDQQTRLTETKLTNGIAQVTLDNRKTVYFLQGHGEHKLAGEAAMSEAVKNLENKNIKSQTLFLAQQSQVPEDAAAVVITGPEKPIFEGEIKALRDYLNRGGNLLVMVDPVVDPKLNNLLNEWGVKLDNRLIIDASGIGQRIGFGPAEPLITSYGKHPITKDFQDQYSVFRGARPVEITPVTGIEQDPILVTNERSWAESNPKKQPLTFNSETDKKGPLVLGVALTRKAGFQNDKTTSTAESRLVVIGNSSFALNGGFEQGLNGDIFLNSVGWLTNQETELLSIRPKEITNRRINITNQQGLVLLWTALFILPLIGLGSAGILWWSRR